MNFERFQSITTAVAQERSVKTVLKMIVDGLAAQPDVAIVRMLMVDRGDICARCLVRDHCPDQTRCLHLVATGGHPSKGTAEDWNISREYPRVPFGAFNSGVVGAEKEPILINDAARTREWVPDSVKEWAVRAGFQSFAGLPLVFRGELLGVFTVYCCAPISDTEYRWLRALADHAAIAVANARAFEEIGALREQLELQNAYLREEVKAHYGNGEMVGQSEAFKQIVRQIEVVAPTDASVLLLGETGTGKELIARAIHESSLRRRRPLIKVNCASIPLELFESEFFGHTKGAFTGAVRDRVGRFQLADGGTIFLDEVGELRPESQSKLLNVLQEGEFERIGEDHTRRVNVRVIAATNRDLKQEMAAGRFRQDLYYRLNTFPIEVPPLRARLDDISLLVEHAFGQARRRMNLKIADLTAQQVAQLQGYDWPGNIRELHNVLERAVIISEGGPLRLDLLLGNRPATNPPVRIPGPQMSESSSFLTQDFMTQGFMTQEEIKRRERENILLALERTGWKIYGRGGAAELLGLKPNTLAARLTAMGIRRPSSGRPA
ncbi:MAG TPA: sigma 54-interacting transcriptional regulator [Candidatus Saccharimonadales bacterium]|jgi:transcriptional regulator with GAF, ATPase, and Fis domain|nr:sigma 54-interacting transcriptional regulator [Candidatus Saccharimonadales bacterium]